MIESAARKKWPQENVFLRDGEIWSRTGNKKLADYGDLAVLAAAEQPGEIRLKDPKDFKLIGTPQARRDSAAKVNGSAGFGLDVRPAGLAPRR